MVNMKVTKQPKESPVDVKPHQLYLTFYFFMKSALIENGEGAFLFIASVNHFRIKRRLFIWWKYLNVWNWIFHTWNFLSLDSKKAYWSNIAKEKRLFSWIVPPVFEMPLCRKKKAPFYCVTSNDTSKYSNKSI